MLKILSFPTKYNYKNYVEVSGQINNTTLICCIAKSVELCAITVTLYFIHETSGDVSIILTVT